MNNNIPDWTDQSQICSLIKKLQSDIRFRKSHNLFFIEGVRNFLQAVRFNYKISVIFYSEKLLIVPKARQLLRQLRRFSQ